MTQSRPRRPEKKNLDILLLSARGGPNADLSTPDDLEARLDLNKDIDVLVAAHRPWHTGERDVGTCVPTTKHVSVAGLCAEI